MTTQELHANDQHTEKTMPAGAKDKPQEKARPTAASQTAPSPTAHKSNTAKPGAVKSGGAKTPSMSQWLHNIAHDKTERRTASPQPPTEQASDSSSTAIVQAAAQMTNDKQRRLALGKLLSAASSQIDSLFVEDKQTHAAADAIERLQPTYRQLVLGLLGQFEAIQASPESKSKLPAQEQLLHALKDPSPYVTALNYLRAAIELLKQAEIADQTPLVTRLQHLSEFDRSTVAMMTKRYQDMATPRAGEVAPREDNADPAGGR